MSTEKSVTTSSLQRVLKTGSANGQSVETLALLLDTTPRAVRKLREELVEEGVPVCAHPRDGYYIAATWEEVQETYDWLRGRGLHTLSLASKLRAAFGDRGADPITQLETEGAFDA